MKQTELTVIFSKDHGFQQQMVTLRNSGGMAGRAYQKVGEVRNAIELGVTSASRFTNNGESRIKNCSKYDLGDGYRLVTVQSGDVVIFCYVGSHDDTDKWLMKNAGLVPVISKTRRISFIQEGKERGYIPPPQHPVISNDRLIDAVSGVEVDKLFPKRNLRRQFEKFTFQTDHDEILEFLEDVEEDEGPELSLHYQELVDACQNSDSNKALLIQGLISGESKIVDNETTSLTKADVRSAANSDQIVVLSDLSEEEIERLWDPNQFDDWMIYLHEGQKRIVDEDYARPAILGGISGSGKTCVLLHRAKRLAEMYPDEGVLILTLNRSLSRLLKRLFENLADKPMSNVIIESFHDYVTRLLTIVGMEDYFNDLGIVYGIGEELKQFLIQSERNRLHSFFDYRTHSETRKLWEQFRNDNESGYNRITTRCMGYLTEREPDLDASDYLLEEFDLVRSGFLFTDDYKGYAKYPRKGRSIGLTEDRKKEIINVLMGWEKYQFKHGFLDQMTIAQAGLWALENGNNQLPSALQYRSVLVDEYQDFSTEELKFISKIPSASENGLFLTGDAGQKIFAKDFDLPKAGLGPGDRERRDIRKNYRNSRQILEAAHELLEAYSGEGTAKSEGITILKPEYAVRMTAKPFAVDHEDQIQCAWAQAEEWIADGCPAYAVAIVTADEKAFPVSEILANRPKSLNANELTGDFEQDKEAVIVSDLNSIKGFEFSLVIIVGLSEGQLPSKGTAKGELWRDALRLYVAMTRARDELVMIYTNKPSQFLKVMTHKLFQREVLIERSGESAHNEASDYNAPNSGILVETGKSETAEKIQPIYVNRSNISFTPEASIVEKTDPEAQTEDYNVVERQQARAISASINGARVLQIHTPATVRSVATALNRSPGELIRLMREKWEEYLQPHQRLHDGYIIKIVEHLYGWKCVPALIPNNSGVRQNKEPHSVIQKKTKVVTRTHEKTNFSNSTIRRCDMVGCHTIAMPGSSVCYTHNTK